MPPPADGFGPVDEPDDGPDEELDGPFRPPLPPEDRLWRHPSEVAAASGLTPAGPSAPSTSSGGISSGGTGAAAGPGGTSRAILLVAGLIGVTLTVAAFALAGGGAGSGPTEIAAEDRSVPAPAMRTVASRVVAMAGGEHAWLGVMGVDLGEEDRAVLGLDGGVSVVELRPDGPAERAGIRPGDVVVEVHGHAVDSMARLVELLGHHLPGDRVVVVVQRGAVRTELVVLLG